MDLKRSFNLEGSLFSRERIEQEKYKYKCKRIRRLIKDLIYENGALCDEIACLQEKTLHMIEERNFLFKKLSAYQPISVPKPPGDSDLISLKAQGCAISGDAQAKKPVPKKKQEPLHIQDGQVKACKAPGKKSVHVKKKKVTKGISLDSLGKPIFPVRLGEITLHSIGDIVDRPQYHSDDVIYPIGFVSSRLYGSLKDPEKQCMYTCKIMDGGPTPRFEIAVEGEADILTGRSIDDLHSGLMERINARLGTQVVNTRGKGAEFFGLKHPLIEALVQAAAFRQHKIDLSTLAGAEEEKEASVSYRSLQRSIAFSRSHLDNFPRESITIGSILL